MWIVETIVIIRRYHFVLHLWRSQAHFKQETSDVENQLRAENARLKRQLTDLPKPPYREQHGRILQTVKEQSLKPCFHVSDQCVDAKLLTNLLDNQMIQ